MAYSELSIQLVQYRVLDMKKLLTLIIQLLPLIFLEGCSKSSQEVIDRCLAQANQTFPNDLSQKSKLFQGCMAEYKYAFNPHSCDQSNKVNLLSEICYVRY